MGRRRRRVIRIVKKKLPSVFVCPRCGEEAVRVTIAKDTGKATVLCALCNLKNEFQTHPAAQPIDIYSYFTDVFYGVENPRAIMPRDREMPKIAEPEIEEQKETEILPREQVVEETIQSSDTVSNLEQPHANVETRELEESQTVTDTTEQPASKGAEEEKREEEEAEPFADILENTNKDKKRYSAHPLPQQQQEQTTEQSS